MQINTCTKEFATANNMFFERIMYKFLQLWLQNHEDKTLLRFNRPMHEYLAKDALRDFFLNTTNPVQQLLNNSLIAFHLGRRVENVYFDPVSGDPLLAPTEQRIYNLARRLDIENMHIPFRSVQPNKQTPEGDTADIESYPVDSEELRYNSGNHFCSRPVNNNVFIEHGSRCMAKSAGNLHVIFKQGYLEDRLLEIKQQVALMHQNGETELQYFVICSRHSPQEGHFGVSLVIMDPATPDFPRRVFVCDTLLKELPQHPRWWHHFVAEYSNVFGDAIAEILEDISHPLQKVNIKGDNPYRHDWDCPYYAVCMADALADLVTTDADFLLNGNAVDIHQAMKTLMPDYYLPGGQIKDRTLIQQANRLKRWTSGSAAIKSIVNEMRYKSIINIHTLLNPTSVITVDYAACKGI